MSPEGWTPAPGELAWLELSPTVGSEQRGRRPALVLSRTDYNNLLGRALVMPVTTRVRSWPTVVPFQAGKISGALLADQTRVVDWRARHAEPAGWVTDETLAAARRALATLAGID